jgi:hypothetical protein
MKDLLYELQIEDNEDEVFAISLVESPAIESDWVYFGKETQMFASVDNEQRMLCGAILIPDKKILRIDGEGQPYHVFFTKQTVKKIAQNYLQKKYVSNSTLEHDKSINGKVHLVESWIKESQLDKSNTYGLNLPVGTWVGLMKIADDKLWNDYVKTGKVKGFSIEGIFSNKLVKASSEDMLDKDIEDLSEDEAAMFLSMIKALVKKDSRYKVGKRVEMESYSDYPDGVKNNAKRVLEYVDKNGWGSCGTPVGKQRANQLAKGEPISVDTIKRMYSFLSRHEGDLQTSTAYGDGCGKLMYDAWGGKAALGWSRNKLRTLGLLTETEAMPSIPNSSYPGEIAKVKKKDLIVAPALIGDDRK